MWLHLVIICVMCCRAASQDHIDWRSEAAAYKCIPLSQL